MDVSMKDRVAVVTGGSKGIGIAVARRFAESGAKVAILARGAADLKTAREALAKDGLMVRDYVCDVSNPSDITNALHMSHDLRIRLRCGRWEISIRLRGGRRLLSGYAIGLLAETQHL